MIRDQRRCRAANGALGTGRDLATRFIFDIFYARGVHGPAMGALQRPAVTENIEILADGLRRDSEGGDQFLDTDLTLLTRQFDNFRLPHAWGHQAALPFVW
ncbi:hypothetical protein D9M68_994520 [compost metagenome]